MCCAHALLRLLEVGDQTQSTASELQLACLQQRCSAKCWWHEGLSLGSPGKACLSEALQQAHEQAIANPPHMYTPAPSMLSANMLGQSVQWPAARASQ